MAKIISPNFGESRGSFLDAAERYNLCRGLRVECSEELTSYLAGQKNKDILIGAYRPHGHMAFSEEDIQQISEEYADKLIREGAPYVICEAGRVIISNTWIPERKNAVIRLSLANYFGVKAIKAEGLKRQNLLAPFQPILQKDE